MFEKIVEAIGRFLSKIFGKAGDVITDSRVEANLMREQAKTATIQAKSTINISIAEEGHVNYFRNRVVGEFLKALAYLVPYEYEEKSDTWVAYFVRRKSKTVVEYIKFSKSYSQDTDADISYTYLNKMISSKGVTTKVGNSSKNVLLVDDAVSSCVYSAISGKKAPLYLCHYIADKSVDVGNPTFIIDCWLFMIRAIEMDVNNFMSNKDCKEKHMIETLMTQAGMHMFMSYFKSLKNPFYRTYYKTSEIDSVTKAVKEYNLGHFNVNKIINMTFKAGENNKPNVSYSNDGKNSIINAYGLSLTLTGRISEVGESAFRRFNYKLAESLVKSDDPNLRRNFIFYMLSTGGVDDKDIVKLLEEERVAEAKNSNDEEIVLYNNRVEPVVKKVMDNSNFKEDADGELASMDFSTFVDSEIKSITSKPKVEVPKEVPPIISEPVVESAVRSVEENNPVGVLYNESKMASRDKGVSTTKISTSDVNPIQELQRQSGEKSMIDRVDDHNTAIKYISKFTSKPLIQWSLDECKEALSGDFIFDTDISRSDVLERMMFLSEKH